MIFQGFGGSDVLGLELVSLTPKLGRYFGAERGVLVVRVPEKTTLKLEEGDVIVDIDGREPRSGAHAMRILRSYQPGEKVAFNVLRDRKKIVVAVTVPNEKRSDHMWALPAPPDPRSVPEAPVPGAPPGAPAPPNPPGPPGPPSQQPM